ncbi:MAG: crotonase/enoyl-CoA hydratase family protein [Gammaproteobacteria bacterium]
MDNNNSSVVTQFYDQLVTDFDQGKGVMWCYANPSPRPCFTPELLQDLIRFFNATRSKITADLDLGLPSPIKYLILGSYKPGIFSLGGDLDLFTKCIKENDREKLESYMRLSIDVLFETYSNIHLPLTTIALIRGNALGAGFEGALACDYLVAEKSVQLGFPEVLFNMFPGMGAYSFLARRISPVNIEKMILSGRIYTAEELFELGVVDYLAEDGEGVNEVNDLMRQHEKNTNTRKSLLKIRNRVNPVTHEELLDIGNIWVDAAMSLSDRDLKIMQRLIRSQDRMAQSLVNTVDIKEKKVSTS